MLQGANTVLADALAAPTRRMRLSLLADWGDDGSYSGVYSDLSPAVDDLRLNREARGSLPSEVSLVEGHNVASLRFRLSGEVNGITVTTLLSTWRTDSPLFGNELIGIKVKYDVVVVTSAGEVTLPRFRGIIRSVDVSSQDRIVDIEVLDLAATLYAPITLPTFGFQGNNVSLYNTNPGINAQWAVDHILRANGIYASPRPAPGAVIEIPGHGGYGPSIGTATGNHNGMMDLTARVDANWTDLLAPSGPYRVPFAGGGGYVDFETNLAYAAADKLDLSAVGKGVACGMWIKYGSGISAATTDRNILILWPFDPLDGAAKLAAWVRLNGDVLASMYNNSNTSIASTLRTLGTGDQWRYLGIHWYRSGTNSWTISIRSDGGTTVGTAQALTISEGARYRALLDWYWWYPMTNIHWWQDDNSTPTWHGEEAFTQQARIQVSNNELLYIPEVRRANSLSLLRDIASAEFARFGFDEQGVFDYRVASPEEAFTSSTDLTVTAERSIIDLGSTRRLDTVRNEVSFEIEERLTNPLTRSWALQAQTKEQFRCGPGTTVFTVSIEHDALAPVAVQVPFVTDASWADDGPLDGFHVVDANDVTIVPGGVTVQFWKTGRYTAELWVFNPTSGKTIQFQRLGTDGSPALRVSGNHVGAISETYVATATAETKFGPRVYASGRDDWRSKTDPFNGVADTILLYTKDPTTILEDVPIVGDPRIQIGDQHRIEDSQGLGSISALVEGFRERWDGRRGLETLVTYRTLKQAGLFDDEEFGILDETFILV